MNEMKTVEPMVRPMSWMSPRGRFYKTRMMAVENGEQLVTPLYELTTEQLALLEKHEVSKNLNAQSDAPVASFN